MPAFTRSPACFAQCVASLADAAPGRFAIGIGSSSNVIVERWNGVPFVEPYKKVRDVVRFLGDALDAARRSRKVYDTFEVQGFRLGVRPEQKPPILVAALREGMLRLAAREADGAIINWLSPADVTKVAGVVNAAAEGEEKEIVCRIFVCPSENADVVRDAARYAIAAYLNVPVYAAFHEWLGRGDVLRPMWDAWQAGDRKAALAAIPDSLVDELDRARLAGRVPGEDPVVLRQRCDHDLAGDHAAGPRAEALGCSAVAGADERAERPPHAARGRRSRSACGDIGGLGGQLAANGRNVGEAAFAGALIEAELERQLGDCQQGELLGGWRVVPDAWS